VIAVADSSPLVILAKLGCLDFLNRVFPHVSISNEVRFDFVIAGAGLPGASEVSKAERIGVKSLQSPTCLHLAQRKYGLGSGEMSTILIANDKLAVQDVHKVLSVQQNAFSGRKLLRAFSLADWTPEWTPH
jgi:predicted nucleic acid-binding protein